MRVGILKKLPILHTKSAIFTFLLRVRSYANEAVTSLLVGKKSVRNGELVQIFRIFGLKLLSAFSRLYSKRGGIL